MWQSKKIIIKKEAQIQLWIEEGNICNHDFPTTGESVTSYLAIRAKKKSKRKKMTSSWNKREGLICNWLLKLLHFYFLSSK